MAVGDGLPIWLRPESAGVGRPAERSRAEVTAAALAIADEAGLAAVSMRRVAARLGTGAGSLYRYVSTRDDLLDLMIDATAGEYRLSEPTGDPVADLVEVAVQARATMRRHQWLPELVSVRPTLGPHAARVLEHVLTVLADQPLGPRAKLELFALLMALAAQFGRHEAAGGAAASAPQQAYLAHLAVSGEFPGIAALLSDAARHDDPEPATDPFTAVLARVLAGYLGH
jgi:AcrR family transcriptional regulator